MSRTARGKGVATALLDGAIDWARGQGATLLEAYPSDTAGRKIPAANAYHGTLSMFESAGFEVVARRQFNRTTAGPAHRPARAVTRGPGGDLRHLSYRRHRHSAGLTVVARRA